MITVTTTKTKNKLVPSEEWKVETIITETKKDGSKYVIRKWSIILPEEPIITQ